MTEIQLLEGSRTRIFSGNGRRRSLLLVAPAWRSTGDFGLNPEHPPLVKLLATAPVLREDLWVTPLRGREFKQEAYLGARDWLACDDGQQLAAGLSHAPELIEADLDNVIARSQLPRWLMRPGWFSFGYLVTMAP